MNENLIKKLKVIQGIVSFTGLTIDEINLLSQEQLDKILYVMSLAKNSELN